MLGPEVGQGRAGLGGGPQPGAASHLTCTWERARPVCRPCSPALGQKRSSQDSNLSPHGMPAPQTVALPVVPQRPSPPPPLTQTWAPPGLPAGRNPVTPNLSSSQAGDRPGGRARGQAGTQGEPGLGTQALSSPRPPVAQGPEPSTLRLPPQQVCARGGGLAAWVETLRGATEATPSPPS